MINVEIVKELVDKEDGKIFHRRHMFNGLVVESQSDIWSKNLREGTR